MTSEEVRKEESSSCTTLDGLGLFETKSLCLKGEGALKPDEPLSVTWTEDSLGTAGSEELRLSGKLHPVDVAGRHRRHTRLLRLKSTGSASGSSRGGSSTTPRTLSEESPSHITAEVSGILSRSKSEIRPDTAEPSMQRSKSVHAQPAKAKGVQWYDGPVWDGSPSR